MPKTGAVQTPAGYQATGDKKKSGKKVLKEIEIEVLDSGYKVQKTFGYAGNDKYDYPSPPREEHALASPEDVVDYVAECLGVDTGSDDGSDEAESDA